LFATAGNAFVLNQGRGWRGRQMLIEAARSMIAPPALSNGGYAEQLEPSEELPCLLHKMTEMGMD